MLKFVNVQRGSDLGVLLRQSTLHKVRLSLYQGGIHVLKIN